MPSILLIPCVPWEAMVSHCHLKRAKWWDKEEFFSHMATSLLSWQIWKTNNPKLPLWERKPNHERETRTGEIQEWLHDFTLLETPFGKWKYVVWCQTHDIHYILASNIKIWLLTKRKVIKITSCVVSTWLSKLRHFGLILCTFLLLSARCGLYQQL